MKSTTERHPLPETANDRLKRSFDSRLWNSLVVATLAHAAVLFFWPALQAAPSDFDMREITAITMPPEVIIPPPPERIQRPANPIISETVIDEDITIASTDFETYAGDPLPPPPVQDRVDTSTLPSFTPTEVPPTIRNLEEFRRLLESAYPPMLRDAGLGGTVRLHFFISAEGVVERALVAESSGRTQLDEAALELAPRIQFRPAMNRDEAVAVWAELPIHFEPE